MPPKILKIRAETKASHASTLTWALDVFIGRHGGFSTAYFGSDLALFQAGHRRRSLAARRYIFPRRSCLPTRFLPPVDDTAPDVSNEPLTTSLPTLLEMSYTLNGYENSSWSLCYAPINFPPLTARPCCPMASSMIFLFAIALPSRRFPTWLTRADYCGSLLVAAKRRAHPSFHGLFQRGYIRRHGGRVYRRGYGRHPVNQYITHCACPKFLMSDHGLLFCSELSLAVCKILVIAITVARSCRPDGNGDFERVIHMMTQKTSMVVKDHQNDWEV